jgi:peptidoglycan/LPS O-acetylase OafA/YrhL
MKKFELVDFLKGYSIFTIMIYHYLDHLHLQAPFNKFIYFGGTGVHLFVLLSGFGLYFSYLRKPVSHKEFVRKRLLKVYVPYIMVILVSAIVSLFVPIYDNSLYALGGHIFLYKMFDESIIGSYGYQLWFISMIIQFYLSFFVIIWLKNKLKNKAFFALSLVVSVGWALMVFLFNKQGQRIWDSFYLQFFWEFALGMLIAERMYNGKPLIKKVPSQPVLLAIALANIAAYGILALKGEAVGRLFNDFFAMTGYSLLAVWLYRIQLKPVNIFFTYIGGISMSVYLLHIGVLLFVSHIIPIYSPSIEMVIALALIIPLSAIFQKDVNRFFKAIKI